MTPRETVWTFGGAEERAKFVTRCGGRVFHAHTMLSWILTERETEYVTFLEDNVQMLKVLPSRSHQYREIETSSTNLNERTTWFYKLDGREYVLARKTSIPQE